MPLDDTERALRTNLLRALRDAYDQENWTRFGSLLQPPAFSLIESRTCLGRWRGDCRTLELSAPLCCERSWGVVLEVLKHEMAHQWVDEVLGRHGEPPHGPTFRRVCRERGIDERAHGLPTAPEAVEDPRQARLRERVRRLLALAESDNRHEAELAMTRAREILLRERLTTTETDAPYEVRWLGPGRKRVSRAEYAIGGILTAHFAVTGLWVRHHRPRVGDDVTRLEIGGRPSDVEMAEYVYDFLWRSAERLWEARREELGGRARQAFMTGVIGGFRSKLDAQRPKLAGKGLVWVEDASLTAWYRARHPRIRQTRGSGTRHGQALREGRSAGQNLVLHRPLGGERAAGPVKQLPG